MSTHSKRSFNPFVGGYSATVPAGTAELPTGEAQCVTTQDPTFERWAHAGLVWLPEKGFGFYPVQEQPYDAAYFDKYVGYAETELGRALTTARLALLHRYLAPGARVLDVGIGSGQFVERARPEYWTLGFDINPKAVGWLQDRALFADAYTAKPDAATFWDSLEHIPDAACILANVKQWVFCSLPIVPGDGPPRSDWRHFRKNEHVFYWTRDGFIRWMGENGFSCVEHNTAESLLGRLDIHSFAFQRQSQ